MALTMAMTVPPPTPPPTICPTIAPRSRPPPGPGRRGQSCTAQQRRDDLSADASADDAGNGVHHHPHVDRIEDLGGRVPPCCAGYKRNDQLDHLRFSSMRPAQRPRLRLARVLQPEKRSHGPYALCASPFDPYPPGRRPTA